MPPSLWWLEIKPRVLCGLGKHSLMELYPKTYTVVSFQVLILERYVLPCLSHLIICLSIYPPTYQSFTCLSVLYLLCVMHLSVYFYLTYLLLVTKYVSNSEFWVSRASRSDWSEWYPLGVFLLLPCPLVPMYWINPLARVSATLAFLDSRRPWWGARSIGCLL